MEMEIEKENMSKDITETIIVNSDNFPILRDLNLKPERNLRVYVDMMKNNIMQYNQLDFIKVMQALFKAEVIEMNVGMRFKEQEQKDKEGLGDWIHFIKGIGKSTKHLEISIGDYVLTRLNLAQLGQELLRLTRLEKFYLHIGKEKHFGATGYTQLGEALRRMTQLKELSIIIGDNCSLGVNGAKKLFQGMVVCEKIGKLRLHIGCYNSLYTEGTQIISTSVGQLKRISDFDLFIAMTNDIGNEGMQSISKNILQQDLCKSAEKLSLKIDDTKGIKAESIVEIFRSIEGFDRLKDLSVSLGVIKEIQEDFIKIIHDSLKKLTSLLRIQMNIDTAPCAHIATPMTDLLTQWQFSNKLMCLQLVIPPQSGFNNYDLSTFAVNLKQLLHLQVFSMEIQDNNLQGNTPIKRKEPAKRIDNKNRKTTKQPEEIPLARGINDISETLSSLKELEKVEWIISTQNDVSDGGWEMLSRSPSLREFRVKIGEGCKLQDEGLHSLSKISSSISLDSLRIDVGNQNETSEGGWSNLLGSVNLEKMKDFKISVGDFNECSEKSLRQLVLAFERSSPHIESLTLKFSESNNITSESIQQLAGSLKSMIYLKQLVFKMHQDLLVNSSALISLSSSLECMTDLTDLKIFFRIQNNIELLDDIRLCSTICSLKKLHNLKITVLGNGYLTGNSIKKRSSSSKHPEIKYQNNRQLLEFRTENGLQFKKQLQKEQVSQKYIDQLTECLSLLSITPQQIVYLNLLINDMDVAEKFPQFTQLLSVLSKFKKCIKLKVNFLKQMLDDISLTQLADSITCMPFLSKVSLKLDAKLIPLKAAQTLAGFFENSLKITKVQLRCKSHFNQAQSQVQFLLMNSILTCPHLRRFEVFFESYSCIRYKFKNQPEIEYLPLFSSMQEKEQTDTSPDGDLQIVEETNENVSLQQSSLFIMIKHEQEPAHDEIMLHLGKFLLSKKHLQTISLLVSSEKQISTKEAGMIQEGILNQDNLISLSLQFTQKCFVTGQGAVMLSQSFANQRDCQPKRKTIDIQTDDTFTIDNALSALISTLNDQRQKVELGMIHIAGTKFIVTTKQLTEKNKFILKFKNPEYIALCQGNNLDQSKSISISQIVDSLSKLEKISDLDFDASRCFQEGNQQDWSSLRQLSFLTNVSIQDQSPRSCSRFLSLESSLSFMTHLQSLTLSLCHTHENVSSQDTIIPFGKCLHNLKEITQFTITLQDFNFGEDGGQAFVYGIQGMTDLEKLKIDCRNPQGLHIEAIQYLCEVISKSSKIQEFNLNFFGLHSSFEIPCFRLLNKLIRCKQVSSKESSISVNGEVLQDACYIKIFAFFNSHIELFQGVYQHLIQLPSKYCFQTAFENEAINKCADILNLYYDSSDETYSLENVIVTFDFTLPQKVEPNLIFLQTLYSVLQRQKRRVKTLKLYIKVNSHGQFQLIIDKALKDIKFVDTLQLRIMNYYPFNFNCQEYYSITSLNSLVTLRIIETDSEKRKILRQHILRKMTRLCNFYVDSYD